MPNAHSSCMSTSTCELTTTLHAAGFHALSLHQQLEVAKAAAAYATGPTKGTVVQPARRYTISTTSVQHAR
jgi:hypothetical protein